MFCQSQQNGTDRGGWQSVYRGPFYLIAYSVIYFYGEVKEHPLENIGDQ